MSNWQNEAVRLLHLGPSASRVRDLRVGPMHAHNETSTKSRTYKNDNVRRAARFVKNNNEESNVTEMIKDLKSLERRFEISRPVTWGAVV